MKWLNGSRRKDIAWNKAPLSPEAFAGKRVAIVGGTNGIGRAIALELHAKGAEVTVLGRTFLDEGVKGLRFIQADLSRMTEARRAARELPAETLDILIFTNGIMAGKQRLQSPEGIELDLAVSYLSRFVMIRELIGRLGTDRAATAAKPRVFIMGFPGANQTGAPDDLNSENRYDLMTAHMNTVIGNEALVLDGRSRYPRVNFYGLNPGLIRTNIRAAVLGQGSFGQKAVELIVGFLFPRVEEYAEALAPLLVSPDIETHSGAMFNRNGAAIHASANLESTPLLPKIIGKSEELAQRALGDKK